MEFNETQIFYCNSHKGHTCAIFVFRFESSRTHSTYNFIHTNLNYMFVANTHTNRIFNKQILLPAYSTFVLPCLHSCSLDPHFTHPLTAVAFLYTNQHVRLSETSRKHPKQHVVRRKCRRIYKMPTTTISTFKWRFSRFDEMQNYTILWALFVCINKINDGAVYIKYINNNVVVFRISLSMKIC